MLYLRSTVFKLMENKIKRLAMLSKEEMPPKGWLYCIRKALQMPASFLAQKLSLTQSRISQIEKQETEGTLTLNTIKKVAEALNCRFVYALIPNEGSLEKTLELHAEMKAKAILKDTLATMALENQVPNNVQALYKTIQEELLFNKQNVLWK